ncbi:MAG: hypothetical protein JSV85_04985 [Candidatus Bathyarchaeota archaeon]|nr:MAG: hypothetical protein JSV85_04985 [Candidatus Bathyarchaeota archaeon]
MPAPKWLQIAKNEYRIHTSRIRKIRPYFPYMAIGLLAVYVAFIAPTFVNLFIGDFFSLFGLPPSLPPEVATAIVAAIMQIILFMIFFYFIILPITYTLKEVQTGQLEIFLAAPIKPGDVLLGEFLGVVPFYTIAVAVIAGSFIALLNPLALDMAQMTIIIIIFAVTFLSALWIGTVIAATLRTRLGKTARGKDIGRALALVIALPMIAIMYAVMGGGLIQALVDPGTSEMVRAVLGLLPSSWGAEVIVGFALNPGNISAIWLETLARFGGLIIFFLAALGLGAKVANRAYSLETITFAASRAKPDGSFYKTVKYLGGGGPFGTLLVSVFKDYSRRLENLSKIFYMVGIAVLMSIFFGIGDPEGALLMPQFILPILASFVVGEVTLRGKETLFIYKKTPSGVARLVKARLLHGWLVVLPITAVIIAVSSILTPQTTFFSLLTYAGIVVLYLAAVVAFVLGLSLVNPAFSDKSGNYMINQMITIFAIPNGLFLIPLIVLGRAFDFGLLHVLCYVTIPLSWLVGIVFLYLGKRRLSRIE